MNSNDDNENLNNIIEPLNIEKINESEIKLYNNKINLKNYVKNDDSKIKVTSIKNISNMDNFPIISSIIISFILYLAVLTIILTNSILLTVFAVLLYICGTFYVQARLLPTNNDYLENTEHLFEDDLKKTLNCHEEYHFRYCKNELKYPGKYITDATGEINIPKDINFVKIGKFQVSRIIFLNIIKKKEVMDMKLYIMKKNLSLKVKYII